MGVFYLSYYSKIKLTSFFFFLVAFTFQFFTKKHKGQEIKMGVLYLSVFGCPLSFFYLSNFMGARLVTNNA